MCIIFFYIAIHEFGFRFKEILDFISPLIEDSSILFLFPSFLINFSSFSYYSRNNYRMNQYKFSNCTCSLIKPLSILTNYDHYCIKIFKKKKVNAPILFPVKKISERNFNDNPSLSLSLSPINIRPLPCRFAFS